MYQRHTIFVGGDDSDEKKDLRINDKKIIVKQGVMVRRPTQRVHKMPVSLGNSLGNSLMNFSRVSSIGVHKRHGSKVTPHESKKSGLKELKMNLEDIYHNHQLTTASTKLHASRSLTFQQKHTQ